MTSPSRYLGEAIYKLTGWSYEPAPDYWRDKQVIVGFPHTSAFDGFLTFAGLAAIGREATVMMKAELFWGPIGTFLRALGGFPVSRHDPRGVVATMIDEFERRDELTLAIMPEGTRSKTARIKTGFWRIAKGAGVPILLWYIDIHAKRTRWLGHLTPGDSMEHDLALITARYREEGCILSHPFDVPVGGSSIEPEPLGATD